MMPKVIRKYEPEEAAARRKRTIETDYAEIARRAFAGRPALNSAVLLVGQFWADEAYDAVHRRMVFSLSLSPDIAGYMSETIRLHKRIELAWKNSTGDEDALEEEQANWENFLEGPEAARQAIQGSDTEHLDSFYEDVRPWAGCDDDEAISLFAAFCPESADQDMPIGQAFAPYCIIRRAANGVDIEIVGQMLRPWLDGVAPQGGE